MHIDLGLGLGSPLIISIGKRFPKTPNHFFALCCGSNDFALWLLAFSLLASSEEGIEKPGLGPLSRHYGAQA
jgi:hypothetical protein